MSWDVQLDLAHPVMSRVSFDGTELPVSRAAIEMDVRQRTQLTLTILLRPGDVVAVKPTEEKNPT